MTAHAAVSETTLRVNVLFAVVALFSRKLGD